jgi:xanthine dehydrogenase accessory factor
MDSVDFEVLKSTVEWTRQGYGATLGFVVRTWGSAPRPVGSLVAVREDGHIKGSVSGGCIEDDLIERMRGGALSRVLPELVTYGISAAEASRFGLPCGGTLQLVLEPVSARSQLPELLAMIERERQVRRQLDLASGAVTLSAGGAQRTLSFDGRTLVTAHGSHYRLLIIGAGQLSRYLALMAQALDYRVVVCDPRSEYADEWDAAGIELTRDMPDDVVIALDADAHTAIVALTHDPKLDDLALMEALKSAAFYVGAIGSRTNHAKRRERLKLFDVTEEELRHLHGPVGLDLGARTPPEIAIAILAEMTALKNGVAVRQTYAPNGARTSSAEPVEPAPLQSCPVLQPSDQN